MKNITIQDDVILELFRTFKNCIAKPTRGQPALAHLEYLLSQDYIPTLFADSLTATLEKCSNEITKWFTSFKQYYNINIDYDVPPPYQARTAFTTAVIILKHLLEYQITQAPSEIRELALVEPVLTWRNASLTLDDIVGFIWSTYLNAPQFGRVEQGIEVVRLLKFRENIKKLREVVEKKGEKKVAGDVYKIFKLLPLPLAYFNLISDAYSPRLFKALGEEIGQYRYKFIITGYGNYVTRILERHILPFTTLPLFTVSELIKSLLSTYYSEVYLIKNIMETLRGNRFAIAKSACDAFASKASKELEQYTEYDAKLDMISYIFILLDTIIYLKDNTSKEATNIKRMISRYIWPDFIDDLPKTWEMFIKKFVANAFRL